MDNEIPSDSHGSDADYLVDMVPFSNKTLIYGIYTKLNEFERHFEIISTKYKYMALSWLLATFAGIGFLLSSETSQLPFPNMLAVTIISFIGCIGVSLIGNLDINVYQRFWAALFVEEIIMEEKYNFLLQSRKITLLIDESKERIFSQGLLYLISNTILIITVEVSLIYYLLYLPSLYIILMSIASFLIIAWSWFFMINNNRKIQRVFHELIAKRSPSKRKH